MKSFISCLSWTLGGGGGGVVVVMFVIQREIPNLHKGFKVILEDGTEDIPPTWKIFNGFRIVDEDAVPKEAQKRKGDGGLVDISMKKVKTQLKA